MDTAYVYGTDRLSLDRFDGTRVITCTTRREASRALQTVMGRYAGPTATAHSAKSHTTAQESCFPPRKRRKTGGTYTYTYTYAYDAMGNRTSAVKTDEKGKVVESSCKKRVVKLQKVV